MNFNGRFQGRRRPLKIEFLWLQRNAALFRALNRYDLFPEKLNKYDHYYLRPPRSSRLGGKRTEATGLLYQSTTPEHDAAVAAYRRNLFKVMDDAAWAYQNRTTNPAAAALWNQMTGTLPAGSEELSYVTSASPLWHQFDVVHNDMAMLGLNPITSEDWSLLNAVILKY